MLLLVLGILAYLGLSYRNMEEYLVMDSSDCDPGKNPAETNIDWVYNSALNPSILCSRCFLKFNLHRSLVYDLDCAIL